MTMTAESAVAKRNDVAVKVDASVIHDAKIVAACENKTLAEFLSEVLSPIVAEKLAEHAQRIGSRSRPPKGKGG